MRADDTLKPRAAQIVQARRIALRGSAPGVPVRTVSAHIRDQIKPDDPVGLLPCGRESGVIGRWNSKSGSGPCSGLRSCSSSPSWWWRRRRS